ncbi:MAG: DUF2147 domain-containing protein [Paracoccaceae bacterium]
MRRLAQIAAASGAFCLFAYAAAADANGRWKTETSGEGKYLVVEIGPCGDKTCGVIVDARNISGASNPDYEHLGRNIISDMVQDGPNTWEDGKIWAPDDDKTYSAEMELKGDVLAVEGCVVIICRGQDWTRVE